MFGALLAHAVSTAANPGGILRRIITAACGVLAQFGGVTLAFAFLATFGFTGFVTVWLQNTFGVDPYGAGGWLTDTPGLLLVYTYFQIPLMVIVFLPALDGLRPQWREATESLGGVDAGVLAARRAVRCCCRRSSAACCCSSRTPSPRTRRRRR